MRIGAISALLLALGAACGGATLAQANPQESAAASRSDPALLTSAPADPGETPACATLRKYMDAFVQADVPAMSALFADDAIYYALNGTTRHGRADIQRLFEETRHKESHMAFSAHSFSGSGTTCWTEIVAGLNAGGPRGLGGATRATVNSDGKIIAFLTYVSPAPTVPRW